MSTSTSIGTSTGGSAHYLLVLLPAQAKSQLQLQVLIPEGGGGDWLPGRKKKVNLAQPSHSWAQRQHSSAQARGWRETPTQAAMWCGLPHAQKAQSFSSGSPKSPRALLLSGLPGSTEVMAERKVAQGLSLPPSTPKDSWWWRTQWWW